MAGLGIKIQIFGDDFMMFYYDVFMMFFEPVRTQPFPTARMQKAFEEASFALKVNELSDVVSTDSGEHLILRIL